jgi:outer membrane murein-binding lipoprotein Lpp
MTPNAPTHQPNTAHQTLRAHLLDSTILQISAHDDKIVTRLKEIARLYHETSAALMVTDRAAGVNSLRAELEMLETDVEAYRNVAQSINVEDIVEMYVVAGRNKRRAEQIANGDFEDLESNLKQVENKVKKLKADIVYGFEEEK